MPSTADSTDAAATARDIAREAAVERARQGDAAGALEELVALRKQSPEDSTLIIDTGVIAAWTGDDALAYELLGMLPDDELPTYAVSTLAKAARNIGRWETALASYDTLIARNAADLDPRLGRIMTLADAGRAELARRDLQSATRHFAEDAEATVALTIACGYIEESAGYPTRALSCYHRALDLDPANREAKRRRIIAASALGAAATALEEARDNQGLLTPDEMLRLEIDAIATRIRWADLPVGTPHGRSEPVYLPQLADLAGSNGQVLNDLENPNGRAYQFDLVSAYVAGFKMQEAIAHFEALERDPVLGQQIPGYTYAAAGRAYIFEEIPEPAERCFRAALAQDPESFEAQVGLFYSLSDQRRSNEARAVAERLLASEPAWVRPTERIWLENDRYTRARQITAMEHAYRESYARALESLDEMLAIAPANASTRVARAQVLSWRGWYRRAETELALAELADPNNTTTPLVAGHVALDSQRYSDAEVSLRTVETLAPLERSTERLEERWQVHNSAEIVFRADAGRSEGSAFASDSWSADAYIFSKPIAYNYRVFVHDVVRVAEFNEGEGEDHRLGVGVEYRGHHFTLRGEINQGFEQYEDTGAAISFDWRATDRLIFTAAAASDSVDVPLRGLRVGISGDTFTSSATYRWHEGRSLTARASLGSFDDDNDRRGYSADYRWRMLNATNHKLLANIGIFTSRNTEEGRPYFNPSRDRTYAAGITHEWHIHRRYQRGLLQRIGVEVGDYWQEDFDSDSIWTFRLEHVWSLGPRWELNYGLTSGGRMYDGDREHANTVFLGFRGRL